MYQLVPYSLWKPGLFRSFYGKVENNMSFLNNVFSLLKTSFMLTFCFQFFLDNKKRCLTQKIHSWRLKIYCVAQESNTWRRKLFCVTIKVMLHKKRDSCRFKIICVAQKRNKCRKKIATVSKKVLYCRKKNLSLHKNWDQCLKKVINFAWTTRHTPCVFPSVLIFWDYEYSKKRMKQQ